MLFLLQPRRHIEGGAVFLNCCPQHFPQQNKCHSHEIGVEVALQKSTTAVQSTKRLIAARWGGECNKSGGGNSGWQRGDRIVKEGTHNDKALYFSLAPP